MLTSLDNDMEETGDQAGPEDMSGPRPTSGTAAIKPKACRDSVDLPTTA